MTDKEINEAVAIKLGWQNLRDKTAISGGIIKYGNPPQCLGFSERIPNYCTEIAAAWEIVEFLIGRNGEGSIFYSRDRKNFMAALSQGRNLSDAVETSDTAPMAICLAFLKLEK